MVDEINNEGFTGRLVAGKAAIIFCALSQYCFCLGRGLVWLEFQAVYSP